MLKAYNVRIGYVEIRTYCVIAPDMASAERICRRKHGENAKIRSIELYSDHVLIAPNTPYDEAPND